MKLHREMYFPTYIFFADLEDGAALNDKLRPELYAWREEDRDGIVRSNVPETGTWHSRTDMAERTRFSELVTRITECVRQIFANLGYETDSRPEITNMWANISPRYGQNCSHTHPGALWSGVYYVQAPEGAGRIVFADPRPQAQVLPAAYGRPGSERPESWSMVHYEPIEGRMIIFPSWLVHEVRPNVSTGQGHEGNRISVSFNIVQRRDDP